MQSSLECNRAFELMNSPFLEIVWERVFHYILHYARIHAFITFLKYHGHQNCEKWCITRKPPLVILIGWSFEHCKGFEFTRSERTRDH